ncbi:MAG: hypothetical protein UT24_C0033G0001, partial [Candidatus Woesebacteria bacterium GW2011_GWB1_39_12]
MWATIAPNATQKDLWWKEPHFISKMDCCIAAIAKQIYQQLKSQSQGINGCNLEKTNDVGFFAISG